MNTVSQLNHKGYEISIHRSLLPERRASIKCISFTIKKRSKCYHVHVRYDDVFGFVIEDDESLNLNWLAYKLDERFGYDMKDVQDIWLLDDYSLADIGKSLQICIAMRDKTIRKVNKVLD